MNIHLQDKQDGYHRSKCFACLKRFVRFLSVSYGYLISELKCIGAFSILGILETWNLDVNSNLTENLSPVFVFDLCSPLCRESDHPIDWLIDFNDMSTRSELFFT